MCAIIAILGSTQDPQELRRKALELSKKLRHRGPDWNGIAVQIVNSGENQKQKVNVLTHERLGIVDPSGGAQPILNEDKSIALSINAEIYNHVQLENELTQPHKFGSKSDCEVVIHLYEEIGDKLVEKLDGMFAFVISNGKTGQFLAARDAIGITTLYMGWGRDGSLWFASEMKALTQDCERFQEFPPGHYFSSSTGELRRWYNPPWFSEQIPTEKLDLVLLRETLERAVVKRLMTDVPYGVLLSGGLDSSLVASIASRHAARRVEDLERTAAWWPRLHSFSIGLPGSPDLAAARVVADFLGTVHHEFNFTVEEGIDALSDVIYHLETYDVTTVRASTAMYFLSRKIKARE
jgi:asparagine synthase (glutamine-hydrolysing)